MIGFKPPKFALDIQKDLSIGLDEITQTRLDEVKAKFERLQSEDPLVTVVLIAYNEEDGIFKTLYSLAQTESEHSLEFIVVNNNSTDRTGELIRACGLKEVKESRQGYASARQAGINAAKGEYIVTGDADTIYGPKWVDKMVDPMISKGEVACTYSLHCFYTDDFKYPPSLHFYQMAKRATVYMKDAKRPHLNCGGASMAYRKSKAIEVGGYNLDMVRGSDGQIAFKLGKVGEIKMVSGRDAQIYTSMRRTKMDGNLGKAFAVRAYNFLKYFTHYFSPQTKD